jgi:PAS domain S-box-containing protein
MQQLVEAILVNLPVGLIIIGSDGRIIEANRAACHILGCSLDEFKGGTWGELFLSHGDNPEFAEVVTDAIQNETRKVERVTPYQLPDGKRKFLSVISAALHDKGRMSSIVVLIEDMTELAVMHQREKDILAQNHRLATDRAKSLIAFARSVAHQIRNPIMSIAGFTRLLKRKANDDARESLDAIAEETLKLEGMVRSVAEYSAIAVARIAQVNLWVVIEEAKRHIENHPAFIGQDIRWKTDCPDMNLRVDRDLMVQALAELLLNSAEFAGVKAEITVCAKESEGAVTITVTDSGPGFTSEGLDLAFDPFYTTKTVGAGMGLTRARRIVGEHQGTIAIANTDDGHARITIYLPVNGAEVIAAA